MTNDGAGLGSTVRLRRLNPFNDLRDCLYYLSGYHGLLAARVQAGTLHLYDLVCPRAVDRALLFSRLPLGTFRRVAFYFTPDQQLGIHPEVTRVDKGDVFFVNGPFPLRAVPFKYPITAEA